MRRLPEPYGSYLAKMPPGRQMLLLERYAAVRRQSADDFVTVLRHVYEDALGEYGTRDENGRTLERLVNVAHHFLDGEPSAMADLRKLARWVLFVCDFHSAHLTSSECAARDAARRLSTIFDHDPDTED